MLRTMLQAKLHHAAVTRCELEYHGSLTIDMDLVDAAGMLEFQQIQIYNGASGARFETYIIAGKRGTGEMQVNGPAARLCQPGDRIVVAAYSIYTADELRTHKPVVLLLDEKNRVTGRA